MKTFLPFVLIFFVWGCSTPSTKRPVAKQDTLNVESKDTLIDVSDDDTEKVNIYSEELESYDIPRGELKKLLKRNPELNNDYFSSPDIAYSKRGCNTFTKNDEYANEFNSETGQDEYYVLYAYFLKKKNGDKKYSVQRERLIDIYRTINTIFGKLNNGGTYFGHQHQRIIGYVEYSIYSQINHGDYYVKKYDYKKQKQLYLGLLTQLIKDEVKVDDDAVEKEKAEKEKELLKSVQKLNELIANYPDLKCAQQFQYSNY